MENHQQMTRENFIEFFRDEEKLHKLTVDDRIEIFRTILIGSSDLTKDLLNEVLSDYSVSNLKVIEIGNGKK